MLLLVAHFLVDAFSSTLPTVQPILVERFSLSLAQAGLLGGFWMFSSSVLQLPFGLLSDRLHTRHYSVLSPLVAALFLTAMGWASNFGTLIALLLIGGMAVAAFHPHSTSQAGRLAGDRRGIATAMFITAGTAGLGLGPLYLAGVVERFGFDRLWLAAVPAMAVAPVLLWRMPQPVGSGHPQRQGVDWNALAGHGRSLLSHYTLVVLRSIVQVGWGQFLALYMVQVRGLELRGASIALAVFLLSTPVGAFLGGAASDRYGGRCVILFSCIGSVPFLAAFMASDGWLSLVALFCGGLVLLTTIPVHVVMAQDLTPTQAGATTALMMGFGWGVAGIVFVPAAGWLADYVGLHAVLWGMAVVPILGLPIALRLPRSATRQGGSR